MHDCRARKKHDISIVSLRRQAKRMLHLACTQSAELEAIMLEPFVRP